MKLKREITRNSQTFKEVAFFLMRFIVWKEKLKPWNENWTKSRSYQLYAWEELREKKYWNSKVRGWKICMKKIF